MSDSIKYWEEQSFGEQELRSKENKETEEYSQDVINIRELFRLLSFEDKVIAKRLLQQEKIF